MNRFRRKGRHVPGNTAAIPATADEIARLYGVAKTTVYRWYEADAFEVAPTVIPSPSGTRDRLLFDRAAVAKQFEEEMLDPRSQRPENITRERRKRLKDFIDA